MTDFIYESYKLEKAPYFPGVHPIPFERKSFKNLKREHHLVTEKIDGERNLLVFKDQQSFMMNRSLAIKNVVLDAPPRGTFKGTILDGELTDDNTFHVFDAIVIGGQNIQDINFVDRLLKIERFVSGIMITKRDTHKLVMKHFFTMNDFTYFKTVYLPSLIYKTDGIVFTPVIGKQTLKWKPREQHTVDFLARADGKDFWDLWVHERGELILEHKVPYDRYTWIQDGDIVECQYYDSDPPFWKPIKIRKDRTTPSSRQTFYKTIQVYRENIRIHEFSDC